MARIMAKAIPRNWDNDRPIYKQLADSIVVGIIDFTYREGEFLPSVRQLASDYLVNPLTAARAYRELGSYIDSERGVGLVLKAGVRKKLLGIRQRKFLQQSWPRIIEQIQSLELEKEQLNDLCSDIRRSAS